MARTKQPNRSDRPPRAPARPVKAGQVSGIPKAPSLADHTLPRPSFMQAKQRRRTPFSDMFSSEEMPLLHTSLEGVLAAGVAMMESRRCLAKSFTYSLEYMEKGIVPLTRRLSGYQSFSPTEYRELCHRAEEAQILVDQMVQIGAALYNAAENYMEQVTRLRALLDGPARNGREPFPSMRPLSQGSDEPEDVSDEVSSDVSDSPEPGKIGGADEPEDVSDEVSSDVSDSSEPERVEGMDEL